MPTGKYSYFGDAITEPDDQWSSSRAVSERDREPGGPWEGGVQAKEPDRQSATRRGTQSSRGRGTMEEEEEGQVRGRSAQRGTGRRGTQARRAMDRGQIARRSTGADTKTGRQKKSRRGFAAMSPEQQREIARKGGLTVSRNRRHMADIGRVGGEHSHGGRRARR